MQGLYGRGNIFVRSMATRGSAGGLAAATRDVCVLMEGFGFDIILVETVGVGQVELDVASVCDTVVVVFVPESGDAIQAMKSGLMEIADVFCLNKSDRPGADRIRAEVESILDVQRQIRRTAHSPHAQDGSEWEAPVVPTIATKDVGTSDLWRAVEGHRESHGTVDPNGLLRTRVRADLILGLSELTQDRLQTELVESGELEAAVEKIVSGNADPYTATRDLFSRWCRDRN
jgi:LAO/AO transport system kinase